MSAMPEVKRCREHEKGKACLQVIAEGNCMKERCHLFQKVLNILPKIKRMYELQAKGVILHTVWRFDERRVQERLKKEENAEKWLNDFYPKILANL